MIFSPKFSGYQITRKPDICLYEARPDTGDPDTLPLSLTN
ncbi:hypothetical protein PITCH_A1150037 [uncultured Desulfobacterium sp.]|uniref:Uncharacterized protein n=1 Tax=uncultured Desulfobacterium sp. TaxID=201089 RepID=A0A445MRG2_9BACT|nr:hypothetical protein PITCH_A1150037 [uncultured Desulfobacterium sp.]